MIYLSNGHSFEYMAASGALAYDGRGWPWEWPLRWLGILDPKLFTIVTKTLTRFPRRGNLHWAHPWTCIRLLKKGVANAVGLTNPGFDWWIQKVAPHISRRGYSLICSLTEDHPEFLIRMVRALESVNIVGIEFNASCPNTEQEIHSNVELVVYLSKLIRENSRHPLILKLSVQQDYLAIAKKLEGVVQALSINSVPWSLVFPEETSPLESLGGGAVSGKIAQRWTWKMTEELVKHTPTPVIGPSVWEFEDIARLKSLGAQALSFGSIFLRYPWRSTSFVKRDKKERAGSPPESYDRNHVDAVHKRSY